MEKVFNKLVRDNIPEIIESNGEVAIYRTLSDEEYKNCLLKKLEEECSEVISAKDDKETLEEIADCYEVMLAILMTLGKSMDDVILTATTKRKRRGGFNNKIFLEKTIDK